MNLKMKQILRKTFLVLAAGIMSSAAWADVLPTPVYFNNFETAVSGSDGIEIVGNGKFVDEGDARFGRIFHNDPTLEKEKRTNYLLMPASVLTHSGTTKEMTIGFWVNAKNPADFWGSPIFTAYENSSKAGSTESWPMFAAWAGGTIQSNCWGWCNFEDAQNDNLTNSFDTFWMDDHRWHYYTITLTTTTAVVYIDGAVKNSWTVSGGDGQNIEGVFNGGAANALAYVCLGGNQPWNQNQYDPAFGFDDFVVYDKALTPAQINEIINNKLVKGARIGKVDCSTVYLSESSNNKLVIILLMSLTISYMCNLLGWRYLNLLGFNKFLLGLFFMVLGLLLKRMAYSKSIGLIGLYSLPIWIIAGIICNTKVSMYGVKLGN